MDEHQQDANSALMELDKGLRAHRVGEQCESIVRFPSLFARFPFPILINSAFLKLADAYRTGNNFMRLCIVRVAQQSTKHLDKILNVDEFMKRIYKVIHSNDPYARALTLRMLGSVACIIAEKKNVHHSIQQGLDSHDRIEQEAAIFATTRFASHSHDFASSICNKLSSMLKGLSTPLEVKLKLIPVMQHMHYDVQISSKARSILQDLLPSYPAQDFVLTTLNTLTQLALLSLIDISGQVSLLLQYFRCDPREAIKSDSLQNLNILAKSAPHLWTVDDISALCEAFNLSSLSDSLKRGIILVLNSLTESENLVQINLEEDCPLLQLCHRCCYDIDVIQSALATKLYSSLTRHAIKLRSNRRVMLQEEALEAAEALLFLLTPTSEQNPIDFKALQIVLSSLRRLCVAYKQADARLIKVLILLLTSEEILSYSQTTKMLLETLAGIASTSHTPGLLSTWNSQLFQLLKNPSVDDTSPEKCENQQIIKTLLCTLLFISKQEQDLSSFSKKLIDGVESSNLSHWTIYRIARQGSRMGQHAVANKFYTLVSKSVASEQHYFWLVGLADLSFAESAISKHFASSKSAVGCSNHVSALTTATHHYHQANTLLTAAATPNHSLSFQCEYVRLRCDVIQAHAQLLNTCSLVRTSPPPAISAVASEGDVGDSASASESGILVNQMKTCANWFLSIDKTYSELHMTSFDSDPTTLANLDILQQSCSIMAYAIDVVTLSRSARQGSSRNLSLEMSCQHKDDLYTRALKKAFSRVLSTIEELVKSDNPTQPLSHLHTDCLAKCSSIILSIPHSYPRYFFQSLQTTNIKLAISPSQHLANEPVTIEINQQLALKVEGVIQHENSQVHEDKVANDGQNLEGSLKTKFRNVDRIKLTMKKAKQGQLKHGNAKVDEKPYTLEQTVEPHNDYFSTQFLIDFSVPGIFNVVIETNVKDDKGIWWNTGPKETVLVKAYDNTARIQQQQQSSRQNRT